MIGIRKLKIARSRSVQIRVVAGSARQADRDAGAKIRRREGAKRGADDSTCLSEVHAAEEVRGDHGDGQGGEAFEQEASGGGDGSQPQRSRENGLSQSDIHSAGTVRQQVSQAFVSADVCRVTKKFIALNWLRI